ncbi:Serine/threonine-protein phosphatase 6 catalytic subunit [Strongyloides ratti]|uniref:Serine/threonine-protein phosphatase n=1 Tax=Strongyloides ratti TaxID=34506 RepID=A0A090L4B2_STRRB|nr:Serine/threonine-protein phosphatase 6 catalytic subunit [Strongyloides ratti]CEF64557.1 Serine/threonine-protein phosphatase 6 catalytic subunit [Strongyloides ratti]
MSKEMAQEVVSQESSNNVGEVSSENKGIDKVPMAKVTSIGNVDLDKWIEKVEECKYLIEEDMKSLCNLVVTRLERLPNILTLSSPATICGDIHGQFYDLIRLFETGGHVKDEKYIFLGDYVDRGYYSLETLTLLLLYFARYPDNIILLRGNHESSRISQQYGFYDECQRKYGNSYVWRHCVDVFNLLPIGALIEDDIFCIHGGLSPEVQYIDQLLTINRNEDVPMNGPLCDLLWSDPEEDLHNDYSFSPRGAGWLFGEKVVDRFCFNNDVTLICRSHQLVNEGFKLYFNDQLCTVWSAPNYCYRCGNKASILQVNTTNDLDVMYFDAVENELRVVPEKFVAPYFL